jgi:hypothetical protein
MPEDGSATWTVAVFAPPTMLMPVIVSMRRPRTSL